MSRDNRTGPPPRKATEPKFTDAEWSEIYYALDSKASALERGEYDGPDDDVDPDEWASELRGMMARIAKVKDV